MPKFYKVHGGTKFYCDEKGALILKDGSPEVVAEGDTEAVDIEGSQDEVTKMLASAMQKAVEAGDELAQKNIKATEEAVAGFFSAVAAKATEHTPKVEIAQSKATIDAEKVLKGVGELRKKAGTFSFEVKSLEDLNALQKSQDRGDITITAAPHILPDKDPEITRAPVRSTFIESIANVVPTDSDSVTYTEVTGTSGSGPATTAELGTIPQKDYAFQVYKKPVEKIAVINKHSVEILNYAPELVAAIKSMLNEDLNIVVDDQLLNGNGTTPNLQGILGVAEELDATAVGSQVVANANLFDVLRIAATKIMTAGKGKFVPTHVILNPADAEELDLTKNATTGEYILPPFYSAQGQLVKGARVIENTGITAGTFLIGDFRYLNVRPYGGVEVEITNSDSDDFQKDLVAIKLRRRLAAYVKNNHSGAFMFGDISDVKGFLAS